MADTKLLDFKGVQMFKKFIAIGLLLLSSQVSASGAGLTIESIFYCSSDFSMHMSNGERWVVRKSDVGEQKLNHFISMAMFMIASDKKTQNVFPGEPISWCGNTNVRPITIFSFAK
jgi:hypothetical protein